MRIIILTMLMIFGILTVTKAQNSTMKELTIDISKKILHQLKDEYFKDSVAVYGSIIKFDIKNINHKSIVSKVTIEGNPEMFINRDVFNSIDFTLLLGNRKEMQIIYPLVILVLNNSNTNPKVVSLTAVKAAIEKLFIKVDLDKEIPLYLESPLNLVPNFLLKISMSANIIASNSQIFNRKICLPEAFNLLNHF